MSTKAAQQYFQNSIFRILSRFFVTLYDISDLWIFVHNSQIRVNTQNICDNIWKVNDLIQVGWLNLWITDPRPAKLPVKKISKKFLLSQKNRCQISGGVFWGHLIIWNHRLVDKPEKQPLVSLKAKRTQLLTLTYLKQKSRRRNCELKNRFADEK